MLTIEDLATNVELDAAAMNEVAGGIDLPQKFLVFEDRNGAPISDFAYGKYLVFDL